MVLEKFPSPNLVPKLVLLPEIVGKPETRVNHSPELR